MNNNLLVFSCVAIFLIIVTLFGWAGWRWGRKKDEAIDRKLVGGKRKVTWSLALPGTIIMAVVPINILLGVIIVMLIASPTSQLSKLHLSKFHALAPKVISGQAFIEGIINRSFYEAVKKDAADGATDYDLDSPGGNYIYAKKIVKIINDNHGTVDLEGGMCGSSCVYIYAYSKKHKSLYNTYFLFHRGYVGWDTSISRIQRALHNIGIGKEPYKPTIMQAWITHMSPKLENYLSECSQNPTTVHKGIWLTYHQIVKIEKGAMNSSCNNIWHSETPKWLTKNIGYIPFGMKNNQLMGQAF
ncbi:MULTISPECIES: hypothetical protein [Acidithiobacillus]|nr:MULTISPECIES: hypothetical protein [Acidithiobacillus]MEB8488173.1 hypothetical protein [Acidithiobacillus ferriphilus]MEB8488759.1 hypothetical protein [Acidithiobacillus ferriphilus]MEB8492203.1 hypothetical protein [Acidithiobacillus ferriphilus]MEB8513506.1 hypothetical protein [Acidithiobacillus ferriphilus]MEB8520686.1 hypothetical protein [Acidithiobacillus ferriphilus]